ncbi:MAG TPA: type II secretion system F family protein [Armatimonadota bacterium]|jgi:tight adherence protein B
MQMIWVALTFLVTVAVVTLVSMLIAVRSGDRRIEELAKQSGSAFAQTASPNPKADPMPTIAGMIRGRQFTEGLYQQLTSAGLLLRPSEFVGMAAGCIIFFAFLGIVILRTMLGFALLGLIGAIIPICYLAYAQKKRRSAFGAQIVDALMMIASSLRSGFSLLRAMQVVSQEMPAPISDEFQRAINEISIGRSVEDALKSMVARVKSYDLDLVVTAITIQTQVGGNLADILDTIAGTIRERVTIMNEMMALTAEGRISGVMLFLLPIFLGAILSFLNPVYMSVLLHEPIGHFLIGLAIVLQILGGWIIHRMLRLDI